MGDLVSVIVPCFNQELSLEEALESIWNQDYPNVEVVVVDDGSTDSSKEKIHSFCVRHPNQKGRSIAPIFQDNAGVIAACNTAFLKTKGRYVLRLDGDDVLPSGYITALHQALENTPDSVGYAYCDAEYFGKKAGRQMAQPYSVGRLMSENYIHVSALVKRSVIEKAGYFNPAMTGGYEDWELWVRFAAHGYRGVYERSTALLYRQHHQAQRNSLTQTEAEKLYAIIKAENRSLYVMPMTVLQHALWRARRRVRSLVGKK